jgi:predicted alpha/beta superfamily hydrolase
MPIAESKLPLGRIFIHTRLKSHFNLICHMKIQYSIAILLGIVWANLLGFDRLMGQFSNHPTLITIGRIEQIPSAALEEDRILNIYLPEGYAEDSIRYPVIYLLDGSTNEDLLHICGLVQFLTMIEVMPKTIVVGIANVDRKRDFTFPTTIEQDKKDFPTTGGSSRFIQFLKSELQPYIRSQFRTNGTQTIIGQSLGGLLATEILLKEPTLFDNYLIVSPSLWWDAESLLKSAPGWLSKIGDRAAEVIVCIGNEGKIMERDAADLAKILRKKGGPRLNVQFVFLPQETHATILHRAAYRGLELLHSSK